MILKNEMDKREEEAETASEGIKARRSNGRRPDDLEVATAQGNS
jgi:hypothetical protein